MGKIIQQLEYLPSGEIHLLDQQKLYEWFSAQMHIRIPLECDQLELPGAILVLALDVSFPGKLFSAGKTGTVDQPYLGGLKTTTTGRRSSSRDFDLDVSCGT